MGPHGLDVDELMRKMLLQEALRQAISFGIYKVQLQFSNREFPINMEDTILRKNENNSYFYVMKANKEG